MPRLLGGLGGLGGLLGRGGQGNGAGPAQLLGQVLDAVSGAGDGIRAVLPQADAGIDVVDNVLRATTSELPLSNALSLEDVLNDPLGQVPDSVPGLDLRPSETVADVVDRLGVVGDSLPVGPGELPMLLDEVGDRLTLAGAEILGSGIPGDGTSNGLFNGHTTNDVARSEPLSLDSGADGTDLAVFSGGGGDSDALFDARVLSFQAPSDAAPPVALELGPIDGDTFDISLLSGKAGSQGVGDILVGPDLWSQSPLVINVLQDPDHPTAHAIEINGGLLDPITDGTLADALVWHLSEVDLFG
ncbi:MAG TPA: hypothetical protein VFQ27_01565 [Xanthobacteraceae bacterium]|nr:hypothetical protein [Xanthobacteraceae bacterium]